MLAADPAPVADRAGLGRWDWAVLVGYFALLIAMGLWFARRAAKKKTDSASYFRGGGHMPIWAVAISFLATAQSAATVLGVPEDAYKSDLRYLLTNLGGILAAIILARFFIPAYYRLRVGTPYQLLEHRFGAGAKLAASATYMLGRVLASGSRVFIGSVPVSLAVWGDTQAVHVAMAVVIFMAFGTVFTLAGGLTSVIWTDVVQVAVYIGAALVTIAVLWKGIGADAPGVLEAIRHGAPDGGSKLRLLASGFDARGVFDFKDQYNIVTVCTGWTLLLLAAYGTDQDLVQRLLACENARRGSWSVISGVLLGIPAVVVFAAIGILLWVYYQCPAVTGRAAPGYLAGDTGEVFLKFALHEMPAGAAGLVLAGVMAAGPAGINSSLNSMAATFVSDVYRPLAPGREDRHYVSVGRWATAAWGLILGLFAVACVYWKQANGEAILPFVLGVMGFAYAGMLGVFFAALFTRRGTVGSAIAALFTGIFTVGLLQPAIVAMLSGRPVEDVTIASPWRLLIGAIAASVVAIIPRGRGTGIGEPPRS